MDKANHKKIKLYRRRHNLFFSPICLPFCVCYLALTSIFFTNANIAFSPFPPLKIQNFSLEIHLSIILVCLASVLLSVQSLFLFLAYWNIRFRLWAGFTPAARLTDATHAYVRAKAHCGPSQISEIIFSGGGDCCGGKNGERTFFFQKVKFVFDAKSGFFAPVRYPNDFALSDYVKSKGFSSESEINAVNLDFKAIFIIKV